MQSKTELFLDFILNSTLYSQFKDLLEPFHRYLVQQEWLNLMETPKNCTEWYSLDLVREAQERENKTYITYVYEDSCIVWFSLWYSWRLKERSIDYKDYMYTEVLELFIREESRKKWYWNLLLSEVEKVSKENWVQKMFLDVLTNNPAIDFYNKKEYKSWEQVLVKDL